MNWPWWVTWWGWWGYGVSFRASFGVAVRGGSRMQSTQAGVLAAYQAARQKDPTVTWDTWSAALAERNGKASVSPRDPLS